jgi:hypothetical protein
MQNNELFNYLFSSILDKEKFDQKINTFNDMAYKTLIYYCKSFDINNEYECNTKRYLVTYNDDLTMFINTGTFSDNVKFSEHIYITRLPTRYIHSLITNERVPNVAPSLHLYGLKLFIPNYIVSHPLNIMDILFKKFIKNGLFTTSTVLNRNKYLGIEYKCYKEYKLLQKPTVEYKINLERLMNNYKDLLLN